MRARAVPVRLKASVEYLRRLEDHDKKLCPRCGGTDTKACAWCVTCGWRPASWNELEQAGLAEWDKDSNRWVLL